MYLDDIPVYRTNCKKHEGNLRFLFQRLQDYGAVINLPKCQFGVVPLDFLDHRVSGSGIGPGPVPDEVQAIHHFLNLSLASNSESFWAL